MGQGPTNRWGRGLPTCGAGAYQQVGQGPTNRWGRGLPTGGAGAYQQVGGAGGARGEVGQGPINRWGCAGQAGRVGRAGQAREEPGGDGGDKAGRWGGVCWAGRAWAGWGRGWPDEGATALLTGCQVAGRLVVRCGGVTPGRQAGGAVRGRHQAGWWCGAGGRCVNQIHSGTPPLCVC